MILLTLLLAVTTTHCPNPNRNKGMASSFATSHKMPKKCFNSDGTVKMRKSGKKLVRDCVVDHDCALECGGRDEWINMQWQTYAESKLKDAIEGKQCSKFCNQTNWVGCGSP